MREIGRKKLDLTGQRFGRLVVIRVSGERTNSKRVIWECKCDCGEFSFVSHSNLRNGHVKSCGCLRKEVSSKEMNKKMKTKGYREKAMEARKGITLVEGTDLSKLTQKTRSNNTSGQKGVYWNKTKKRWQSYITIMGKNIYLGRYVDKQDAIDARLEAEEKYFKPILEEYEKKRLTAGKLISPQKHL